MGVSWLRGALVGAVCAGCAPNDFTCSDLEDCAGPIGGQCEPTGFCSFPDETCESMRRYGEFAGAGLANQCTRHDPDPATTSGGSSSGATSTSTSTGSPIPVCGDGRLDAEEDCDDGNAVDGDGCNVDCVVSGSVRWIAEHDVVDGDDRVYEAVIDASGEILAVGYSVDPKLGRARWLGARHDAQGTLVASEILDATDETSAFGIALTPSGQRIETGERATGSDIAGWVRAFEGAAEVASYDGALAAGCQSRFDDVQVDGDGTIFVAGRLCVTEPDYTPYLVALDPTLMTPTWEFLGDPVIGLFGQQLGVALDGQGRSYLAGLERIANTTDYNVIVYGIAADGTESWRGTYTTTGSDDDRAADVIVRGDGTLVACGYHTPSEREFWIGHFEPPMTEATTTWSELGTGPGTNECHSLLALPDGGYAAAGWLNDVDDADDFFVVRFDANGEEIWRNLRDRAGLQDRLFGLALDASGDIVAAGYTQSATEGTNYVLVRYAP